MPIIGIIAAVVMSLIASSKGFSWWLWALAAGIPGLIILLCLPSASANGISAALREKRRKVGNTVGGVISSIAILLIVVLMVWISNL